MKHLWISCLLALTLLVSGPLSAKTVSGIDLPASLTFEGNELTLNGAGMRSRWFIDLYVGSLYLPEPSSDAAAIISADEPMAITLHITSGRITSDRMTTAINDGFEAATNGNTAPIQDEIDEFMGVFQEEIQEGDVFQVVYLPENGIRVYKNGNQTGSVNGSFAFKEALFGIWLGDEPAQSSLKKEMLSK